MHAWIFRNRQRLRLIYGHAEPLRVPSDGSRDGRCEESRAAQERPGRVLRLDEGIELRPMPRRVG